MDQQQAASQQGDARSALPSARLAKGDPESVLSILDSKIDAAAVYERISTGLASRHPRPESEPYFPDFQSDLGVIESLRVSPEFDYELRQALDCHDRTWVSPQDSAVHIPLVGPFLTRAKHAAHSLVVFYTNMLAAKQVSFNAHAIRALSHLAAKVAVSPQPRDLEVLREELSQLRARVARLEADLAQRVPPDRQGQPPLGGDEF